MLYQLFHAVGQMSAPDGRPTNAVFGFARDLFYFRDELHPDYLIYVFDPHGPTFRDAIADDYKAHRKPPDDDLIVQIPMIQQLLTAANVPVLSESGYEADDVIATLAVAGAARGFDVVICSSDKDCRQLIGERVRILNLRKKTFLDRQELLADWGVTPEQAIDYQTLVGDSVDNVKGVRGVGDKTAAKLLQKFGSLDNLLANIDKLDGVVSPKIQAAIKEANETGVLDVGRKLVRLETAVPMTLDWNGWRTSDGDAPKLLDLFQEWGFRGFASRMRSAAAAAEKKAPVAQGDLFSAFGESADTSFPFGANAAADGWKGDYQAIDTPAKFKAFFKDLKKQNRFAIDLETTGLDPLTVELVGLSVCWKAGEAYYLPVRGPAGNSVLDQTIIIEAFKPIL